MVSIASLLDRVVARARGADLAEQPRGQLDEFELDEIDRARRAAAAVNDEDDQ